MHIETHETLERWLRTQFVWFLILKSFESNYVASSFFYCTEGRVIIMNLDLTNSRVNDLIITIGDWRIFWDFNNIISNYGLCWVCKYKSIQWKLFSQKVEKFCNKNDRLRLTSKYLTDINYCFSLFIIGVCNFNQTSYRSTILNAVLWQYRRDDRVILLVVGIVATSSGVDNS